MKLIDFRRLLFALSLFLKESRLGQDLMSLGRRFQDSAARCYTELCIKCNSSNQKPSKLAWRVSECTYVYELITYYI